MTFVFFSFLKEIDIFQDNKWESLSKRSVLYERKTNMVARKQNHIVV